MEQTRTFSTYQITLIAVMAAVISILAPFTITIPVSPVPISLTTMTIAFAACILGWKLGTLSCLIYILLGFVGLPVFAGFTAGIAKLGGPTGGYIIGYLFEALIIGYVFDHFDNKVIDFVGMLLGVAVCYLFGTAWLCVQAHLTFMEGLAMGVIPYIPGDIVKMLIVIIVGPLIKKRLRSAGLL